VTYVFVIDQESSFVAWRANVPNLQNQQNRYHPHLRFDMSPVDSQVPLTFSPKPIDLAPIDLAASVQQGSAGVARLLEDLASVAPSAIPTAVPSTDAKYENKLAVVRLGMATSLYSALRAKHGPSASHSLRVALICAAWADRLQFEQIHRDRLEAAALLHDIGKIAIPDQILRKPGKLTVEEQMTMSLCTRHGCEILLGCCNDPELLDIILYANCWYSGRRNQIKSGEDLPIGARMLAIADAFDSMTTDHVYRPAMSREAAIGVVLNGSGTQFDPELANDFCRMMQHDVERVHRQVLLRWLREPVDHSQDTRWAIRKQPTLHEDSMRDETERWRFHDQLFNNMTDAVIYIDRDGMVQSWNYAAEKLTGIASGAVVMNSWGPGLLGLFDDEGAVHQGNCPVQRAFETSSHVTGRFSMRRADGSQIPVRLHVAPVASDQPGLCGVVLIAHDASQQRNLEARVESLHKQATQDPLTKVANRAAFDRFLHDLVERRNDKGASFSLIICDIDHFKRVNDVHGHPAGDEALVTFAAILSTHSREGDLVSRYGGEEFVLLSPDCDINAASRRAETIRQAVEQTLLPSIGNQSVTASFGVTEVQAGDSPDSVLARADRALLQAKDNGRNQVIQLGIGSSTDNETDFAEPPKRRRGFWSWFDTGVDSKVMNTEIVTPVPVNMAIAKLRGFIADHKAEIVSVSEGNLHLRLNVAFGGRGRRSVDSYMPFSVRLRLSESFVEAGTDNRKATYSRTRVKIELEPTKSRDRRRKEVATCANHVIIGLRSYLMGRVEAE
jgi:diguanylate cyclase (GGDEF)-like protein/PAS domain S-box-containing protein